MASFSIAGAARRVVCPFAVIGLVVVSPTLTSASKAKNANVSFAVVSKTSGVDCPPIRLSVSGQSVYPNFNYTSGKCLSNAVSLPPGSYSITVTGSYVNAQSFSKQQTIKVKSRTKLIKISVP